MTRHVKDVTMEDASEIGVQTYIWGPMLPVVKRTYVGDVDHQSIFLERIVSAKNILGKELGH